MHELAIKDALTGLRNKTAFDKEVVRIQEMKYKDRFCGRGPELSEEDQ